jgi:phage terminase large subunit
MEFKKTTSQKKAITQIVNSFAKNIMLFGGARAAKTFLAVFIIIVRACLCKSNHAIVRNTFNSVKNSIWMETLPKVLTVAFPNLPIKWDRTNYMIALPNESTVRIFGLDDGEKLERILGLEFSTLLIEECNQVPWKAVQKFQQQHLAHITKRLSKKSIL